MVSAEVPLASAEVPLASVRIPLSALPRLADTASFFSIGFGPVGLLVLLGLDLWRSYKKKTHWIAGDSFVLGALSLQLVENKFRPIVSISDERDLDPEIVKYLFGLIHNNQLLTLGGRVMACVFYGILLPSVGRTHRLNLWSDLLALAIGAVNVLIHISYEIYIIVIKNWINNKGFHWNAETVWLVISNTIIFVSIVLLVLLLFCAALASKGIQEEVDQRIATLLCPAEYRNPGSVESFEATEQAVVWTWMIARTYSPEYIIARSVLSSFAAFLVTVCIAVSTVELFRYGYKPLNDGLDLSRQFAIFFQEIFISIGWAIISWRWLTAVVYYPRRLANEAFSLKEYFRVEGFWIRATLELKEFFKEWHIESIEKFSYLMKLLIRTVQKLRLYKFLPVLHHVQIVLIMSSKMVWLISERVFSNKCMHKLLIGPTLHDDYYTELSRRRRENDNPHNGRGVREHGNPDNISRRRRENDNPDNGRGVREHGNPDNIGVPESKMFEDFIKYSNALMHMPGENIVGVWLANKTSILGMQEQLARGKEKGISCIELIRLLKKRNSMSYMDPLATSSRRKLQLELDFNIENSSAKMTAVSLLAIIIELPEFFNPITVTGYIKACCDAWKIMELVDDSDWKVALVNKHADRLFLNVKERPSRWLGLDLPFHNYEVSTLECAKAALNVLADRGKEKANIVNPDIDWKEVIAGNNMYNMCETLLNHSHSIDEMIDVIDTSLARVIWSCMHKVLGKIMIDKCLQSAWESDDDEIHNVLYLVGIATAVNRSVHSP